jgi:hypothetical protein
MKNRIYKCLVVSFALFSASRVDAQIGITGSAPVTENFNTLGNSATASLPAHWKMSVAGISSPTYTLGTNVSAVSQAANSGTPATGGRYNWGNGTTTTDRAIGFMTSGSYSTPNSIMAAYQNASGMQINDLTISFDYERYRINTAACNIQFFTSTDGTTWTARTTGDNTFSTGASAYDFNGGTVASKTVTINGVNIASNGTFYLLWTFNMTGSSNAQGIGLDNVSVTATLQPCSSPSVFNVTGTGFYCTIPGTGVPVGLSGSQSGYLYQLRNGSTNIGSPVTGTGNMISFGNQLAGTYTVLATNPSGNCTANMNGSATVTSMMSTTVTVASQTNVACHGDNNGSVTVNTTGGSGISYSWDPAGGTASTASNLAAGNYTCTVANSSGCVSTVAVAITQPPVLAHSVASQTNLFCHGDSNGSATISASGGTPSYTYSWSPSGGTAATASGLVAGAYTCTINDSHGCTGTETVTITEPTAITHSVSSQASVSCSGGHNGAATVSVSGGTPGYVYSWAPSGGTAAMAGNLAAGTYTCNILDGAGCSVTQTVMISEPAAITHSISTQANVSCHGGSNGSATVMANGGTGTLHYSWAPSGGTAATASGLMMGTYTVTVTDNNGCSATQTVAIMEPVALVVSAGNDVAICNGSSTALNGSSAGGTGAVSYLWTPGNMTTTSVIVSPTSGATYTLTATDSLGCTAMETVIVTVNNLPTIGASANPATICYGDPTTLTGTGAATYAWSNSANGASVQVAPTSSTSYTVTGTDVNGCVNTGTVTVSVIVCTDGAAQALSFDGINDHISGTNGMLPQGNTARSFTAWIKPSQVNTTQTIFSYGGMNANQSSAISINGGNLYYSSGSNDMSGTAVCAIPPNVWTHVAVTVSNKTVRFYINGVLKYTGTLSSSPATSGINWSISSLTSPFDGWMDEVTVWNTAITSQIGATMNRETASGLNGQVALYHFNQGFAGGANASETTAIDASVLAGTGTLTGFALNGASSNWVAPGRAGITKLKDVFCGTTLANMNTQLLAEMVSNATDFQWKFTDIATSSVYTYTRGIGQNNFYISYIPQLTFNKTYSVQVKAYVNGAWTAYGETCTITTPSGPASLTQLQSVFCGTTLADLSAPLSCDGLINVTNYEWEFTDMATGTVYTYIRGNNQPNFYMYWIPQLTYAKTYSVRVKPYYNGAWGTFGNSCQITTPAFPTTSLQSVCGTTIPSRYTEVFITAVPNAQNYEYEFTDVNTSNVFTVMRGNNQVNFYLYMVSQADVNTTYDVRVRAISGGSPGPYGSVCTITTPATMARMAGDPVATPEELSFEKEAIGNETAWNFLVYPNPGVGTFYLQSNAVNAQVEIYDALGGLVSKEQITGNVHTIKLDENRKGMFYLRVMNDKKTLYSTKLVNQ